MALCQSFYDGIKKVHFSDYIYTAISHTCISEQENARCTLLYKTNKNSIKYDIYDERLPYLVIASLSVRNVRAMSKLKNQFIAVANETHVLRAHRGYISALNTQAIGP